MTYGYGEEMPPRRRDQYRDESEESAASHQYDAGDAGQHGQDWPQQPQSGAPRPPQTGGPTQYGNPNRYSEPTTYGGAPGYGSGPSQYSDPTTYGGAPGYGSGSGQYGAPQSPSSQPQSSPPSGQPDPFSQGPYPPRPTRPGAATYGRTYGGQGGPGPGQGGPGPGQGGPGPGQGGPGPGMPPPPGGQPPPFGSPAAQGQPGADYRAPTRGFPPPQRDAGPYRGGDYGGATQYGGGATQYGGQGQYGAPGQYGGGQYGGNGPGRAPEPYDVDRYQPQPSYDQHQPDDDEPEPKRRSNKLLIVVIIIVVLVIGGGGGWYYLHRNSNDPVAASVHPPTAAEAAKVADQKVDPTPLTEAEVFGAGTIPSSADGGGSYKIVKTQLATDCKSAVGGDIAAALTTAGCTQVVRATMTSPDGTYVITAGIFNLASATKASAAQTAIKTAINVHKGRFSGLAAGGSTNVIEQAAANVAWDVRGHYLTYCVIAMSNGSAIASDDSRTHLIISDVVESYLGGTVIHKRESGSGPTTLPS